jgi:anthranilate phosphoribosyltransferase
MALTFPAAEDLVGQRSGMSEAETRKVLDLLMAGTLTPSEGGGLLAMWANRGETGRELAAVVRGLLERAAKVPAEGACLDLCGTGGSGLGRYNVSTTAAFVLAAAGARVAKHGNRGSTRANGSFDFLEALGVPFQLPGEAHAALLESSNVCFLFARAMHPTVAAVAPYRKAAARRTIFNLAGPLANPCRPSRQLIGVAAWPTAAVIAEALTLLGVERALVVQGEPGIDEISISGRTRWLEVTPRGISEGAWSHPRLAVPYAELPAGEAAANAALFHQLTGGGGLPELRAMVAANAAAALDLWRDRPVLANPATLGEAEELLTKGATRLAFERHRMEARKEDERGKGQAKA